MSATPCISRNRISAPGMECHSRIKVEEMPKSVTTVIRTVMLIVTTCAMLLSGAPAQMDQPPSEAAIADLKAKSEAFAAAALARLGALTPQQRLAAPPEIWRVPGA